MVCGEWCIYSCHIFKNFSIFPYESGKDSRTRKRTMSSRCKVPFIFVFSLVFPALVCKSRCRLSWQQMERILILHLHMVIFSGISGTISGTPTRWETLRVLKKSQLSNRDQEPTRTCIKTRTPEPGRVSYWLNNFQRQPSSIDIGHQRSKQCLPRRHQ